MVTTFLPPPADLAGNPTRDWLENEEAGAAVRSVVEAELLLRLGA